MNPTMQVDVSRDVTKLSNLADDLASNGFDDRCVALLGQLNTQKIVIDVGSLAFITGNDYQRINQLHARLSMVGCDVVVCGINKLAAIMAVSFEIPIQFKTARNYEHALHQF